MAQPVSYSVLGFYGVGIFFSSVESLWSGRGDRGRASFLGEESGMGVVLTVDMRTFDGVFANIGEMLECFFIVDVTYFLCRRDSGRSGSFTS